jgi:hypothetical protein
MGQKEREKKNEDMIGLKHYNLIIFKSVEDSDNS